MISTLHPNFCGFSRDHLTFLGSVFFSPISFSRYLSKFTPLYFSCVSSSPVALSFFCTRFFLPLKWHFLSVPLTFPFWNFSRSKTSFARGADSCSLHRLLIYDAYLIILLTDGHGRVCSNIVFWLLAFLKLAKSWKALCPGHPNCQIWKPPPILVLLISPWPCGLGYSPTPSGSPLSLDFWGSLMLIPFLLLLPCPGTSHGAVFSQFFPLYFSPQLCHRIT